MKKMVVSVKVGRYSTKQLAPMFNRKLRMFQYELARIAHKLGPRPNNGHKWSAEQVAQIFYELGGPNYEIVIIDDAANLADYRYDKLSPEQMIQIKEAA